MVKADKIETGVQAIDRAFEILETLAEHRRGLGVAELASIVALNKSTVHRILQTLVAWGYISKDEKTRTYRLGMKIVALSSHYLNGLELRTEALPFMEILQKRTEQFVHLGLLDGKDVIYLEKLGSHTHLRMYSQVGKRATLYSTSLGKAIFAQLGEIRQQELLKQLSYERITERTVRSEEEFLREIERTKRRGYAIDDEENETGMRCVAAPIMDYTGRVIAAVSVSGYVSSFTRERVEEFGAYVLECAGHISEQMGYQRF